MRAPFKLFFGALLLTSIAIAQQAPLKFQRAYKEGEKDAYRTTIVANTAMGTLELSSDVTQRVAKLHPGGDVDVETAIALPQAAVNGQVIPSELIPQLKAETVVTKIDAKGVPKQSSAKNTFAQLVLTMFLYSAMVEEQELKIGEPIVVDRKYESANGDEKRNQHATGTIMLKEVANGIAKLETKLKITSPSFTEPILVDATSQIEVATSKPSKVEGRLKGLPEREGMRVESLDFKIERAR